ncbi:hypothetical protein J2Z83_002242 [Virgibacillus natechei]|uniref:Uncharacterized protein n=1 Tax=Virgibacillus natechei TaxID=1216297 RepID=A0ABS4IGQ9_9BACI|nr:hypothetical protein [Virgibacillus natechei]
MPALRQDVATLAGERTGVFGGASNRSPKGFRWDEHLLAIPRRVVLNRSVR